MASKYILSFLLLINFHFIFATTNFKSKRSLQSEDLSGIRQYDCLSCFQNGHKFYIEAYPLYGTSWCTTIMSNRLFWANRDEVSFIRFRNASDCNMENTAMVVTEGTAEISELRKSQKYKDSLKVLSYPLISKYRTIPEVREEMRTDLDSAIQSKKEYPPCPWYLGCDECIEIKNCGFYTQELNHGSVLPGYTLCLNKLQHNALKGLYGELLSKEKIHFSVHLQPNCTTYLEEREILLAKFINETNLATHEFSQRFRDLFYPIFLTLNVNLTRAERTAYTNQQNVFFDDLNKALEKYHYISGALLCEISKSRKFNTISDLPQKKASDNRPFNLSLNLTFKLQDLTLNNSYHKI